MPDCAEPFFHITRKDWRQTPAEEPRGYIDSGPLKELWFHTGTICNLSCPFCLEGSKPGDDRLNKITLEDVRPFVEEALELGVEQFSFTGGEPFVIKDMVSILDLCLEHRPCLVLTNATDPLKFRLPEITRLKEKAQPLSFRVSLDYPDPAKHDAGRGEGNFLLSLEMMRALADLGFAVSVARQRAEDEDTAALEKAYQKYFKKAGLPAATRIVSFPDFSTPGAAKDVPAITENCMTTYHTVESRAKFMCHFSKMVIKKDGRLRVYACTLVDDDEDYDLGGSLREALRPRIMLKHHRCYACFSQGASCSEIA